jgi:hypothetical protein
MFTTFPTTRLLGVAAAVVTLALGAAGSVSASTDTTEPGPEADTTEPSADSSPAHTDHAEPPASLAVDGSAEPSSAEAETFCEAELAAEVAFASEDEAEIGAAVEAISAAAEPVGLSETVGAMVAAGEDFGPEFEAAYAEVIEYMKANCGYAEVDAVASEYQFEGLPAEIPAGGAIFSLENAGEQVHELAVMRINDDVTLTVEELLALPQEEAMSMVTPAAFAFAFPGTVSYGTADLTAGRYFALCFLPDGATPEVLMQLEEVGVDGPEDTIPEGLGIELGPPHFTKGMVHEFTVA